MPHDLPTLDETEKGYLVNGNLVFGKRFLRARSFHMPEALAAVADESGAYHIGLDGAPGYPERFLETAGFYEGLAAVRDSRGWFHIRPNGSPAHGRRFRWSGNFQEGRCAVLDCSGFLHIGPDGTDSYSQRYGYVGDFRGGIAVGHGPEGAVHLRPDGSPLNACRYRFAEPFHKGYAVVADEAGYYHVDKTGRALHGNRFRRAEPFYNGVALCIDSAGRRVRLRENGEYSFVGQDMAPVTPAHVGRHLAEGRRVALFIRHSERHPITPSTPDWGNGVLLTERGAEIAASLGRTLSPAVRLGFWSSPIARCQQTCEAIARGAGVAGLAIATDQRLGAPGIYIDGSGSHATPMRTDYHAFVGAYLDDGRAPGMRSLSEASQQLLEFLHREMAPFDCTIFITHDLFAAALMGFLGLKAPCREDWCDYLEGVCLVSGPDGYEYRRFVHRGGEALEEPC
jgi:broad specificity phosphatase PhoE